MEIHFSWEKTLCRIAVVPLLSGVFFVCLFFIKENVEAELILLIEEAEVQICEELGSFAIITHKQGSKC